jgi:hypothetical protein
MLRPIGDGSIACVQRAGERYYFPCKLSLEPALTEREMTNWAPTYRLRHLRELRDRLNPVRGMVTERPYELGMYLTKGRRRPDSKVAVDMDVSKDRCGSRVEKTPASGERSASKGACCVCAVRRVVVSLLQAGGTEERFLGYWHSWKRKLKVTKHSREAAHARKRCRAGRP